MSQYTINIGTIPNDGTGDPLRTAFNETNLNFNQIFTAGPVLSNIQIANNTILTTNTNGNLVLVPNGIGRIQANATIVPSVANVRDLGSATQRWSTVYTQYVNATQINLAGDLTVSGNLTVQGNIIQIGNIVTDSLTIQLANTATTGNAANGAGLTVGLNDDIATLLYNSTGNVWNTNIGLSSVGNITAPYFFGNGSQLTGISSNKIFNGNSYANIASANGNLVVSANGVNWTFDTASNLTLPGGGLIRSTPNVLTLFANTQNQVSGITFSAAGEGDFFSNTNVVITTNVGVVGDPKNWIFDTTGNIILPGNLASINYANGQPYGGNYGNSNVATFLAAFGSNSISTTGNVTANRYAGNVAVLAGLNIRGEHAANLGSAGFTELDSNVILQITGNANSYTQVNFQNINNGNRATTDYIATAAFGTDSTYFVDMGIASGGYDQNNPNNSLGTSLYPQDSYLYAQGGNSIGGTGGNLVVGSNEPGGVVRLIANGSTIDNVVATFSNVGIAVSGIVSATGDVTGANLMASNNFVGPRLVTNLTDYNWSENITGITTGATTTITLANNVFGDPFSGQVTIEGVNGTTQANGNWWYEASNPNAFDLYTDSTLSTPVDSTSWGAYTDGGFAYTLGYTNIEINAQNITIRSDHGDYDNKIWGFNRDGGTVFPTLTVDLHNGGTQTGQTLQFGDSSQQAIITGPAPTPAGSNAQRLIIQGQNGGDGEGGDVYVWGGDSNVNGGDIKIYAGDADTAGRGGNIHIAGGRGTTTAGEITLEGGQNDGGDGAYVSLTGGRGTSTGGVVSLNGGFGEVTGGDINITGGIGGNGLGSYGNVGISAGSSSWAFDNTGNLTLPQGGIVYETNIPFGGLEGKTIALKPYGGTNADQQLLVYPTAGADFNHLHLTTGNLWNTEMFLGNDDFYVKLANTGNIVINSNDDAGNSAQWTFGTAGTILNSGNLTLQTPNGVPGAVTAITGSSGSWESNPVTDLPTTGGNGSGLTVNVTQEGGYAGTIAIVDPGTGYNNGDTISVVSGSSSATFTISVLANSWTFDTTGNLNTPQGGWIGAAGVKGDGTMLTGGTGNIASLTSFYADAPGIYAGCFTANPDGTLNITTYGNGTGQLGQWVFTGGNLTVPGILTGEGTGEIQTITGSRRSIGITNDPDFAYAATFDGHSEFGNVAFTASTGQVQSIKVTFVIQTNGVAFNWEQFDVAATKLDGANAFVSVSNRVRSNSAIDYTDVSAYVNEGGAIEIRLNPPDGQTVAYVNYDAVEFNLFID